MMYNQKVQHREFFVNDLVLRKVVGNTKDPIQEKLNPNWEDPYKISKLFGTDAYNLEDLKDRQLPRP